MNYDITFISDTHSLHDEITMDLPGGDLLIHAGDVCNRGSERELHEFLTWFDSIKNYQTKVFVAGNHDWALQRESYQITTQKIKELFPDIYYLQDSSLILTEGFDSPIHIYGSPWQPEFNNWAFNLPRNGEELRKVFDKIPPGVDILVTHSPAYGFLDYVPRTSEMVGCEILANRIELVKPKIHVHGHIHSASGRCIDTNNVTHRFNAAVLNERYWYANPIQHIVWNSITNQIL